MQELDGQVVLVSGASGGLGSAVVQSFLAQGALVAGVARHWKNPAEFSNTFLPLNADLSQEQSVAGAVESTLAWGGRIDAAIHVMGGFASDGPVERTALATWDHMMSINARSAFLLFRAVLPAMQKAGRGRLIAIGSRSGEQPAAGQSAYAASKAALHMLVRVMAAELGHTSITANAILPSTIDTAANRAAMPNADANRWVAPAAIGELACWLCSSAAADINGALIPVYGKA
jgi:NAD(P)-dependent dehydrogenase (short-subunit alcohol dehydrogenase family)